MEACATPLMLSIKRGEGKKIPERESELLMKMYNEA